VDRDAARSSRWRTTRWRTGKRCPPVLSVVQTLNGFLRKGPCDRRIAARDSFDAIRLEEKCLTRHDRLHEHWRRSADEGWHTEEVARTNIADRDLPAVAGVHVDAKQAAENDRESLGIRFRIERVTGAKLDGPSALEQRLDHRGRQRCPDSRSKQTDDARSH
jgi:hypothetical protein